jgi:ABC-type transport system substrate-binding protein
MCLVSAASGPASAADISIAGWPVISLAGERPSYDFGDEPVVGRQICPPLTRLNLKKKSSEGIILRRAVEEFRGEETGSLWRLELRTGIYWWSGELVTAAEVAKVLQTHMDDFLKETFQGVFQVPSHQIHATDSQTVTIDWKKAPPFGPYVFNGMPLFRPSPKAGLTKFECAGNYRPESLEPLVLVPASGYNLARKLPTLRFTADTASADLSFRFSGDTTASVGACQAIWSSPYFSVISWNLSSGRSANAGFRQLMPGLIPRNEIITSGVLAFSDVVSAPIPRNHPGYNSKAEDMSYDAQKVSGLLNSMGYKRKKSHVTRTDPKGKPVRLVLVNSRADEGLVEKLISDSFSSVGMEVDFVEKPHDGEPDGYLSALKTDYPRIDFMTILHPKTPKTAGFWTVKNEELQKQLEDYALTVTREAPDFAILANIHGYLADQQVFTVIAHHRACIKAGNGLRVDAARVSSGEPDWFRDILF